MPRYLITHPTGQQRDDILIDGDDLELTFIGGWAVVTDTDGVCLALPSERDATIQRVDDADQDTHEPAA